MAEGISTTGLPVGIYSYRLSIIHFWGLIFVYIWAGPHHLLYTAIPDWAQSMGMVFSLMLWVPSWGGMSNGLLTVRGAWGKLRTDPVVKFFIAGITFYGMATFEGPLLSIKSVSALGHYTDWIIGHVHGGTLGWNGFMAAGMFYWLVPKLYNRKLHSQSAANFHFWFGTLGILLYMVSMWVAGIQQGLMWRAETIEGALLYPNFVETLLKIKYLYVIRLIGGSVYFVGFLVMAWNLVMTAVKGEAVNVKVKVYDLVKDENEISWTALVFNRNIMVAYLAIILTIAFLALNLFSAVAAGALLLGVSVYFWLTWGKSDGKNKFPMHSILEGRSFIFTILVVVAVVIGGVVEIIPTLILDKAVPLGEIKATPYRALELHGRDIYVREGCYLCHSQMIRPFRSEKLRYGNPSKSGEFIYDHPFQWGSKRTGPDLHRVGGKYPYLWHYNHMMDPRSTSQGSNMPAYDWMKEKKVDYSDTLLKLKAMKTLGVPYTAKQISFGVDDAKLQAAAIQKALAKDEVKIDDDSELIALIAYLQRLGTQPEMPTYESKGE